jgi:hypothetical protein
MTGEAETFHATALVEQLLVTVLLLLLAACGVAFFLDVFYGLVVLPDRAIGLMAGVAVAGLVATVWSMSRPDPVLVIDAGGLDWQFRDAPVGRIGWNRIAAYAIYHRDEMSRLKPDIRPANKDERYLAVHLEPRADAEILTASEVDIAPGIDQALAALRRHRPDLEIGPSSRPQ